MNTYMQGSVTKFSFHFSSTASQLAPPLLLGNSHWLPTTLLRHELLQGQLSEPTSEASRPWLRRRDFAGSVVYYIPSRLPLQHNKTVFAPRQPVA